MQLGEIIKQYREENKMSMDDFSKKSNITKGYISMLENKKNPKTGKSINPSLEIIKQVADAIRIDLDILLKKLDGNQEIDLHSEKTIEEQNQKKAIETIGAHFDGKMTKEEMNKIIDFVEFIKSQRNK